jgi:hypothetical protein
MKIHFEETSMDVVLKSLQDQLKGRKLGEMVSFAKCGQQVEVTISKLGKSTLVFDNHVTKSGQTWTLSKEKIALTHRAFKDEVMGKIHKIVENIGGHMDV